jgi:hypothetical protein
MSFIFDEVRLADIDSTGGLPADYHFDTTINYQLDTFTGKYLSQKVEISRESESGNISADISISTRQDIRPAGELSSSKKELKSEALDK